VVRVSAPPRPDLEFERLLRAQGWGRVAGVDEVGRGSWAGPLVAAAVVLPFDNAKCTDALKDVCDSKQLDATTRESLFGLIVEHAASIGIGWSSHHEIDGAGLGKANRRALLRAVLHLHPSADAVVIDHFKLPECLLPQISVTKGDCRSLSVAAASIVAKVVRDRWMVAVDRRIPGYRFAFHKGYGTPSHRVALTALGPSPIHRMSFRPLERLNEDWQGPCDE